MTIAVDWDIKQQNKQTNKKKGIKDRDQNERSQS